MPSDTGFPWGMEIGLGETFIYYCSDGFLSSELYYCFYLKTIEKN